MTNPGVQNPHWLPWCRIIACWTGWSFPPGPAMPSTVRTAFPWIWGSSMMQELTARLPAPSPRTTVQAPQSPSLQPSLVPVKPLDSRSQSSSVSVGAGSRTASRPPLRTNSIVAIAWITSPANVAAWREQAMSRLVSGKTPVEFALGACGRILPGSAILRGKRAA